MRNNFFCLLLLGSLLLNACGTDAIKNKSENTVLENQDSSKKSNLNPDSNQTKSGVSDIKSKLIGYYVGDFKDAGLSGKTNKINISIDKLLGDSIYGHSVVAGNYRPWSGKITFDNFGGFIVYAKEPGDNPYDGEFRFNYTEVHLDNNNGKGFGIKGSWKSFKPLKVSNRMYILSKVDFVYNPNQELFDSYSDENKKKAIRTTTTEYDDNNGKPVKGNVRVDTGYYMTSEDLFEYNPSVQVLTREIVSNLKKADIFILRNSIYARHGYSFKNPQLRNYFDLQSWYIPVSADVTKDLTKIEKDNIILLKKYEEHAKEYYDVFGR